MPRVLLTGATGKTGLAVLRALARRDVKVRALVHKADYDAKVRDVGAVEIARGDFLDAESLSFAADGISAIYHICPNMHPDEVEIGERVIAAAHAAGVRRFVYHSVLRPQIEAMPHHWQKMRVEERLWSSDFELTVLQPAALMQNLWVHWPHILEHGSFPLPYSPEKIFTLVDLEDVAEAAAVVLTEPGHAGATYELCGPENHSHLEIAEIFAAVSGRPVTVEHQSLEAWEKTARSAGLDGYALESLMAMFRYYDHHGFVGNGRVLRLLLGRTARSLRDVVASWP